MAVAWGGGCTAATIKQLLQLLDGNGNVLMLQYISIEQLLQLLDGNALPLNIFGWDGHCCSNPIAYELASFFDSNYTLVFGKTQRWMILSMCGRVGWCCH